MWQTLKKILKVIVFVFVSISIFAVGKILAIPIVYILYSVMFRGKDFWSVFIKALLWSFVAIFVLAAINNGFQQTVDEIIDFFVDFFLILGIPAILIAGSGSRTDAEKHEKEMKELYERMDKNARTWEINRNLSNLRHKRGKLKTHNSLWDWMDGGLTSESELKRNQKYFDKLSDEIDRLEDEKNKLR